MKKYIEIDPDQILIDSSNLPGFNTSQFEGRLEKPISRAVLYGIGAVGALVMIVFLARTGNMQISQGDSYLARSENNILRPVPIFAGRGVIYDRNGALLAWNAPSNTASDPIESVAHREYATSTGLAHTLGYVQYPSKDTNGFYYQEDFQGVDGVEKYYNELLSGVNGSRLVEVDARGKIISQNVVRPADQGGNLTLSIDNRVQSALYNNISDIANRVGFKGGAGVIMDVRTGEVLAMTSYPEYSPQVMSDKTDSAAITTFLNDSAGKPFLDRVIDGLYTPGSIVKPYMAMGALTENIIDPTTVIVTKGSISIPNPYDPTLSTLFRDWKNLGPLDIRHAIAMSSDVFFYTIGGGYKDQKGMGIANIDKYLQLFGFGNNIPPSFFSSQSGTIPTPDWKKKTFNEDWYIGDTYHTVIGQYGTQVTPIQVVRGIASIANNGSLLVPTIVKGGEAAAADTGATPDQLPQVERTIDLPQKNFQIVHEGMRLSVSQGTSVALNVPYVNVAGKSGTAELGVSKARVNSWITGFWPYENPHYAFAVMLESGSVHNLIGAAAAMRQQLDWMHIYTPEYLK
ncbi:MAG: penicillin-binding transpeptidase domain-containing protein [Candidatus Taylorbacteria bacterium]